MKYIIKFGILSIFIFILTGCNKQLPQTDIKDFKTNKRIGILSSIQNTLNISRGVNINISHWKINDYLEEMIYNNMKDQYKNILIVPKSRNVILLNEERSLLGKSINDIIKENNLDALILIKNHFEQKVYAPGLNFTQLSSGFSDTYINRKQLNINIALYIPGKGRYPVESLLYNDFDNNFYDDENLNSTTQENKLEKTFKQLLHKEIYTTLQAFKLIK